MYPPRPVRATLHRHACLALSRTHIPHLLFSLASPFASALRSHSRTQKPLPRVPSIEVSGQDFITSSVPLPHIYLRAVAAVVKVATSATFPLNPDVRNTVLPPDTVTKTFIESLGYLFTKSGVERSDDINMCARMFRALISIAPQAEVAKLVNADEMSVLPLFSRLLENEAAEIEIGFALIQILDTPLPSSLPPEQLSMQQRVRFSLTSSLVQHTLSCPPVAPSLRAFCRKHSLFLSEIEKGARLPRANAYTMEYTSQQDEVI